MKTCPTCQLTFDDDMKFCQSDGTLLVAAGAPRIEEFDPYKTMLGNSPDLSPLKNEPPSDFDPMKTMLGTPPQVDAVPPSPFDLPPNNSADLNQSPFGTKRENTGDINPPHFNDSPFGGFQEQQQPPLDSFSNQNRPPQFQEPESPFGNQAGYNNPPFGQQPNDWSAPPAPTGWGNQGLGQNTPFQSPPMNMSPDQNLAIGALGTGIFSLLCCQIAGPVALILGYLAMNKANQNPQAFGGKGFAIGGMITGGLATVVFVGWILINLLAAIAR